MSIRAMGTAAAVSTHLYEDFADQQVRVVSDHPVSKTEAKALAARIEKAWINDEKKQKWDDEGPLRKTLTVAVLSREAFSQLTGDSTGAVAGVTTGKDLFVMPDRVLHGTSAEDNDTIAHELAHVQDFRQADKAMEQIPTYLEEGKAYVLGDTWGRDASHLADIAHTMASFNARDAAYLLANFRTASAERNPPNFVYGGEVLGALFVEYLTTHVKKDAIVRLCDAIEATGKGAKFGDAFQKSFGTSLPALEKQFVQFIAQTEDDPKQRLAGTAYASHY